MNRSERWKLLKAHEPYWNIWVKALRLIPNFVFWIPGIFFLICFSYLLSECRTPQQRIVWAKQKQIPAIQRIIDESFFPPTPKAFEIANDIDKTIPEDSTLRSLWSSISAQISVETEPPGAKYFWKDYDEPDQEWNFVGTTPFKNLRIPSGLLRIRVERKGFQPVLSQEYIWPSDSPLKYIIRIDSMGLLPENMVRIPSQVSDMLINGLFQYRGKRVSEFLADQYEVTNKEYKKFVNAGGYSDKTYWRYPVYQNGKELSWSESVKLFTDKTGRPGPSTWEDGSFPPGKENYPICGISWYEADAFAEFIHKSLPTVHHWSVLANTTMSKDIVPLSNFNGTSTVPVGKMEGISSRGIYDLAGNVREWCRNEGDNPEKHFILGGAYNDLFYDFNCAHTLQSLDRSPSNGFRCIKELPGDSTLSNLTGKLNLVFRDYTKEKPVDNDTFNSYLKQFVYDKTPLNPKVIEQRNSGTTYNLEKVTINAAYNNEQFDIWVYLPKDTPPPYQSIIFLDGSDEIQGGKFNPAMWDYMDFIVKSGRALIFPVLKSTYERSDEITSLGFQNESEYYKDHVIMWREDLGRTIDYLETRNDILADKIGYFGLSWGSFLGGILTAVETRIKAMVFLAGGMQMYRALPEVDQINYLPHITQPILMMNGRYDMFFPVETAQKPMFQMLGSKIKERKTYNEGHIVPRLDLINETLKWYDQNLGEVKKLSIK
jgi:dienelactone hydrolase